MSNLFIPDSQIIRKQETIVGITKTNPPVVTTSPPHGLLNGDQIYITNVEGMVEVNDRQYTVENRTTTTFELLSVDATGYGAYTGGGMVYQRLGTAAGVNIGFAQGDIAPLSVGGKFDASVLPATADQGLALEGTVIDLNGAGPTVAWAGLPAGIRRMALVVEGMTVTAVPDQYQPHIQFGIVGGLVTSGYASRAGHWTGANFSAGSATDRIGIWHTQISGTTDAMLSFAMTDTNRWTCQGQSGNETYLGRVSSRVALGGELTKVQLHTNNGTFSGGFAALYTDQS